MANLNILGLALARLRNGTDPACHILFVHAPVSLRLSTEIGTAPFAGMDQGPTLPILRESPPPKKR